MRCRRWIGGKSGRTLPAQRTAQRAISYRTLQLKELSRAEGLGCDLRLPHGLLCRPTVLKDLRRSRSRSSLGTRRTAALTITPTLLMSSQSLMPLAQEGLETRPDQETGRNTAGRLSHSHFSTQQRLTQSELIWSTDARARGKSAPHGKNASQALSSTVPGDGVRHSLHRLPTGSPISISFAGRLAGA